MRSHPRSRRVGLAALGSALLGAATLAGAAGPAAADGHGPGRLYAITNATTRNDLVVWDRAADGRLGQPQVVAGGGTGTGAGLGSQGAVTTSDDGRWVVAVDAGSDEVSLFRSGPGGVRLVGTAPSGGDQPVSVAVRDGLVYVLNAGMGNNISGLRITDGGLTPIPGSTRALPTPAAGGAQVAFSDDGRHLLVTEKAANAIATWTVRHGLPDRGRVTPSTGTTPFGFAVDPRGRVLVSNANGGAAAGSSLSSYAFRGDELKALDGPEPTNQTAACWVAVSRGGRFAYTTNTGSNSITGYRVGRAGGLDLLSPDGVSATTGSAPTDVDTSRDGRYLYTLGSADHTVTVDRVEHDGSLTPLGRVGGLPATTLGLAAD